MKFQHLLSVALATLGATSVSAIPVLNDENHGQCPPGYTMSVYYVTVTVQPTTTPIAEPTSSLPCSISTSAEATATLEAVEINSSVPPSSTVAEVAPIETYVASEPAPIIATTSSIEETATIISTTQAKPTTTIAAAVVIPTTTTTTTTTTKTTTAAAAASTTAASSKSTSATNSGEATFYGGNVSGGTCSFAGYTLPAGLFGTALSAARWDDAAQCGSCVSVTGPSGNSIKAMIVDQCPECESNHLDLFQDAFAELAAISEGIINIDWSYVSCDIDSPLILKNKEGTSQWWFSMQVVNSSEPVVSLEVSTDGGSTWQGTTRTYYNYFENETGFGTDTVDIKVTGQSGRTVVVNNVSCASGSSVTASSNL